MPDDASAEVCTMLSNKVDIATFAYHQFMYNDAAANWGHKKALLDPSFSEIGIGITIGNGPTMFPYGSLTGDLR